MTLARFSRLLIVSSVVAVGCAPRNVPPDQAQVTLSNARVERINGEDNFLVDFKFTRGKPDRNRNYQFVLISGSNEKYWVDKLWTEKTLSGTIEAELSVRYATFEPSKYFEGHLEILTGYNEGKSISNTVTFGTPTADDIVGGDGKPAPPPPRSQSLPIAQTPPVSSAVPDIPVPPVGIGPGRSPRPGGVGPFGGVDPASAGAPGVPPPVAGGAADQPLPRPPATTLSSTIPVGGKQTPLAGGKGGVPFAIADAEQRMAVGFRYAVGSWAGQPALRFLEPLYERPPAERTGEVVARDGYAVAGLNVNAGQYVHAVQIVFARVTADGKLDPADSYTSDWLGTKTDASTTPLDSRGAPIIGIHGRKAAILDAIGLVLKP
jgi:hypothetical protein